MMTRPKLQNLFFLVILIPLTYLGCNYSVNKNTDDGLPIKKLDHKDVPSFKEINDRIFIPYDCAGCHAGTQMFNPSNYDEAIAHLGAIRSSVSPGARKRMPEPPRAPLTQQDLEFLLSWIDNGAPREKAGATSPEASPTPATSATPIPTPGPSATPDPILNSAQPSFAQLTTTFLKAKCFVCHDGIIDPDAIDFQAYPQFSAASAKVKRRVLLPISDKRHMPVVGDTPQLSKSELEVLVNWIDAGAPENGRGEFQFPQ